MERSTSGMYSTASGRESPDGEVFGVSGRGRMVCLPICSRILRTCRESGMKAITGASGPRISTAQGVHFEDTADEPCP